MFHVTAGVSLLAYLHWIEFKHPAMASVNFLSRRVRVPVGSKFKTLMTLHLERVGPNNIAAKVEFFAVCEDGVGEESL